MLVHLKNKLDPREGVYKIDSKNCDKCYIIRTKRNLAVRVKGGKQDKDMCFTREAKRQSEGEI